ncbi:unnamed protein product [Sphagnum compactum]
MHFLFFSLWSSNLEEDSLKSHHRKYCIQGSKCNPCVAAQSESLRRDFLQHTALMMWY